MLWQAVKKPARQGDEDAKKGVYPFVNDRILRLISTQQVKILSNFFCSKGFLHLRALASV